MLGGTLGEPQGDATIPRLYPNVKASPEVVQSPQGPSDGGSGRCCSFKRHASAPQPDADCATAGAENHLH